ncbi:MAG: response regulator [Deltaproteobacteria bacterium]|nr:response regulator [Deltaproteobacteria bacterium]
MSTGKHFPCGSGAPEMPRDELRSRAEELYRSLFLISPDAVVLCDLGGRLVMANEEAARLYGCTSVEEFLAQEVTVFEFFAPADRDRAHDNAQAALNDVIVRNAEYTVVRKDGSTYPAEVSAKVVRDEKGNPQAFIGVLHDLTARKAAEAERQGLQARIQHAQKLESLGILAGGIAHDFNNLLMAVIGNASLAKKELPVSSAARRYVEQIELAGQHAAELTNQLLAYSGKGRFVVRSLDLSAAIEEMADLLRVALSKKVTLVQDLARDLPSIGADASQIRQVIMNLVANASEAIGDERGVVTLRTFRVPAPSDLPTSADAKGVPKGTWCACLEVTDTGCGMDKETLARIFDPFFSTKFTGRGLGLAAVQGIVRGHGGAITVDSRPGKGTTLRVLIPCETERGDTHEAAPSSSPPPAADAGAGQLILVIDDERIVREVAQNMLEAAGYRVITAADGPQGLSAFRKRPDEIAAVLLDNTMPRMDGAETFEELRRIRPDVKVILSSGYNEQEVTARFAGRGLAGFLQKPYDLKGLLRQFETILGGKA